ncbi:hypothetical protein ANANG_G00164920 [Anguilla anguilla]|uniref:StAR-related lipid transfer protein 13 n=1 Tax=Anguilla anguilla TaxID=7936 RepID=A0A9D3MBY4_ANGAN|nr:hypothetical protein ANANG_G00164920 [Anguilla anguilla]
MVVMGFLEDLRICRREKHNSKGDRRMKIQKIEAKEACDWLRAAGFPQYSQLFEDSQFPIDISAVKKDHDFLDKDLVEPLCRRLNTLNKCASMKLDVNIPKKKQSEDSDEDDPFAISDRWTFERRSRRWSRLQDIDGFLGGGVVVVGGAGGGLRAAVSSESVLTDMSEPEVSSLHSESSGGGGGGSGRARTPPPPPRRPPPRPTTPTRGARRPGLLRLAARQERAARRTRAKDFLRRMELLRTRGTPPPPPRARPARSGHRGAGDQRAGPAAGARGAETLRCAEIVNGAELLRRRRSPALPLQRPIRDERQRGRHALRPGAAGPRPQAQRLVPGGRGRAGPYTWGRAPRRGRRGGDPPRRSEFGPTRTWWCTCPRTTSPGPSPRRSPPPGPVLPGAAGSASHDNVPGSHLYASTGDLLDLERAELFPTWTTSCSTSAACSGWWTAGPRTCCRRGRSRGGVCNGAGFRGCSPPVRSPWTSRGTPPWRAAPRPATATGTGVLNDTDSTGTRERRDSRGGASLTRPTRLRWPSFRISNRLSQSGASLQITSQSAGQLSLLQKFSLLRLTAIMEKYSMSNKHGWTWSVPRFMKRNKVPDYKDKNIFGVPLIVHVQRTGQPLPLSLQQALRYLRSQCLDQVGLFRKSGDQSAYDVADMVKQFFRDLPEPLLTSKLGETFLHIYQYVPKDQRLQAVQAAIMLMSDENREVLQTLLCFLSDVTSSVEENQMTPMNIAVCLAPSLFHLNILKKDNLSPRAMQKKYATGRPDQKDLSENLAATQGLAHMITECDRLFEIPHEMVTQSRSSYVEAELPVPSLEELCKHLEEEGGSYHAHLDGLVQGLLKEARDRSKSWVACTGTDGTEVSYKKVGDGNPLRRWRVATEVEAPPSVVLNRVLRERHLWDVDLLQWKVLETLDRQTEVYQYALGHMPPHPSRDFVVLRSWRTDMPKGACALVSMSVEHEEAPPMGGVRGVVLESQGRTPEWYNKAFGHLCAAEAARIRDSFHPLDTEGPETKI